MQAQPFERALRNSAVFSDDRKYRYSLWRTFNSNEDLFGNKVREPKYLMFIGLNPSTANENSDDPTIRRVVRFATDWGYDGVYMMNLFAWVTAYPKELKKCADPLGENNDWLKIISGSCDDVIFAWGNFKEAEQRAKEVMAMFPSAKCLGKNKNGTPKHPLYIAANTQPIPF